MRSPFFPFHRVRLALVVDAGILERDLARWKDAAGLPLTCELRLLASARFDSQPLLCVVLAGDARLIEKLRREELIPLGSRIRTRLATEHASRDELLASLNHLLAGAGNASLMTPALRQTLCDHAAGNYRILTTMAAELLAAAAQRELAQLDEKLYLEVFAQPETPAPRRAGTRR
jgi:general secretion pathway protein A